MALHNLGRSPGPSAIALPSLSVANAPAVVEGTGGTTALSFTVTRSGDTARAVSCNWMVGSSGANPVNAADFAGGVLPSGTLTIPAGASTGTITVAIAGDDIVEPDESVTVILSNATMSIAVTQPGATATVLNDDAAPTVTARIIAANRTDLPTTAINFAQNTTARRVHYASPEGTIGNLRTIDVGFYVSGADALLYNAPAAVTIKRFVEYPSGVFTAVTWGGSPTTVIAPGATVTSDPVALTIPAGAAFHERTVVVSPSPNTMPTMQLPAGAATLGLPDGKIVADMGNTGTIAADNSVYSFGACAILGDVARTAARGFVLIGDSIAFGQGDVGSTGSRGGSGWIGRGLDPLYPYAKIAVPGQGAAALASVIGGSQFAGLFAALGYTDVIEEHGINDLRVGRTPAQLQADLQSLYAPHVGKRIYQTTLTPRADSGNGYADVAGQTPRTDGTMPMLASVNAAIRGRQANVTAIIEAADAAMSARDSGVWGGPFPPVLDGTHPTSAKAAAMATIVASAIAR